MKRNAKLMLLALGISSIMGGTAYAEYDEATKTETLTNQMISSNRGGAEGDLTSYNHPDRDLVINWGESRTENAPVTNTSVTAKSLTMTSQKYGIIEDKKGGETTINVSGDIGMEVADVALLTEEDSGKIKAEGFTNLNITAESAGIIDGGEGITVTGGEGSKVTVISENDIAVGNYPDKTKNVGTGVSIKAGDIAITSRGTAIRAGQKDGTFTVDIDAKNKAEIKGMIHSEKGGKINIKGSTVKVAAAEYSDVYAVIAEAGDGESSVSINEGREGQVQLDGGIKAEGSGIKAEGSGIKAEGKGSKVTVNMTGDESYLKSYKAAGFTGREENITQYALDLSKGSAADITVSGKDSAIIGDISAVGGSKVNITATGENFRLEKTLENLVTLENDSEADISIEGKGSTVEGDLVAEDEGKITFAMKGDGSTMTGAIVTDGVGWKVDDEGKAVLDDEGNLQFTDGATFTAEFSGKNATVTGTETGDGKKIAVFADGKMGDITVNFTGEKGTLIGDVSTPKNAGVVGYTYDYDENNKAKIKDVVNDENTVTLSMSGEGSVHEGNLTSKGENILNASYTGKGSSLTVTDVVTNEGTMNLAFDNGSTMTGNIYNGYTARNDLKDEILGNLTMTFDNASVWNGNIENVEAQGTISFTKGSIWNGNIKNGDGSDDAHEADAVKISLDGSTWNGNSIGDGTQIYLKNGSVWNVKKDEEEFGSRAGLLDMSEGSTVSLAGDARILYFLKLKGSGTFLMDLKYLGDDIDDYYSNDDSTSDFIEAPYGEGTFKIKLSEDSDTSEMTEGNKLYFAMTAKDTVSFTDNDSVEIENSKKIYNKSLTVKSEDNTSDIYEGFKNWYLEKTGDGNKINENGLIPGAAYSAAFALWRDDDTLLKRLGDLRDGEEEGLWARFVYKRLSRDGSDGFKGNYKTLQVGVDKEKTADDGIWYYGGALGYTWGDTDYSGGDGKQKVADLSVYATKVNNEGKYLDLVAKFGRIRSDYDTVLGDNGEFTNWGSTISAEYGQKRVMDNGWIMEPQIQLAYNYLWGDDYTTKNGAKVEQDNADSLVGRLGIVMSREFMYKTARPSRVYVKASVLHDFLGETASTVRDDILFTDTDDLGDTWFILGAGTNLQLSESSQFYFDVERNFNAKVETKYRLNAGVRFRF